jgi:hypothetical protein
MRRIALTAVLATALGVCAGEKEADLGAPGRRAASQPAPKASRSASNLDYWLGRATVPATQTAPAEIEGTGPLARTRPFARTDALPGALELSDGTVLAGGLYTTRGKAWSVYDDKTKRWRRVPFAAVLSITAVVVEEKLEPRWRWKAMGVPERVYTGETYPTRRYLWRFVLPDGSEITGPVKGQPLWIALGDKTFGPFVLHERYRGKVGQKLGDLIYIRKIVVSRRLMCELLAAGESVRAASRPVAGEK